MFPPGSREASQGSRQKQPDPGSEIMKKTAIVITVTTLLLALSLGCGGTRRTYTTYTVPPRVDLTQLDVIGVIEIDSSSKGELGTMATRRLTDEARRDQGLVRIVALGTEADALASVGKTSLDREALKELGRKHGLHTIMKGKLDVSDIRPNFSISSTLESGSITAKVIATMSVELVETASGASIWSTSSRAADSVGHIRVFNGGDFVLDAEDPERAYGQLVDRLVHEATHDFRVTYERR
jgi:hypothetical protein